MRDGRELECNVDDWNCIFQILCMHVVAIGISSLRSYIYETVKTLESRNIYVQVCFFKKHLRSEAL